MAVTHLMPVHLYETCLKQGGTHRFEITADEMPGLGLHPNARFGIRLTCEEALPLSGGVWRGILKDLAGVDAICTYRKRDSRTFEVICYVPVPAVRQRNRQHDENDPGDLSASQHPSSVRIARRMGSRRG